MPTPRPRCEVSPPPAENLKTKEEQAAWLAQLRPPGTPVPAGRRVRSGGVAPSVRSGYRAIRTCGSLLPLGSERPRSRPRQIHYATASQRSTSVRSVDAGSRRNDRPVTRVKRAFQSADHQRVTRRAPCSATGGFLSSRTRSCPRPVNWTRSETVVRVLKTFTPWHGGVACDGRLPDGLPAT